MTITQQTAEIKAIETAKQEINKQSQFLYAAIERLDTATKTETCNVNLENLLTSCQIRLAENSSFVKTLDHMIQLLNGQAVPSQQEEGYKTKLTKATDFEHGDIVQIISRERNCGIQEGTFKAIVVESKTWGLIAIPQEFHERILDAAISGAAWEWEISWLIECDVDVFLIERPDELMRKVWNFLE